MKASEVKVGMRVKIESTDSVVKGYNSATGKVQEIVEDDDNLLGGFNIIVAFDKKCKAGAGQVVSAADIVAI